MSNRIGSVSKEAALAEIARSPVEASITKNDKDVTISVKLPYNPPFLAKYERGVEPGYLFLKRLEVDPNLIRNYIATRLMAAMAYAAKIHGFHALESVISSPHSMKIIRKLFDEESIRFYDTDPQTKALIELPMTIAEAIMCLERSHVAEFDFEISLAKTALDSLEEPIFVNTFRG